MEWDVGQLIKLAQRAGIKERLLLFDQVAWLCEGAGQRRLGQALDCYLGSMSKVNGDGGQQQRDAQILLALLGHLPSTLDSYRIRLLFITSTGTDIFGHVEPYLRMLASEIGTDKQQRYQRFRSCIGVSLAALFTDAECSHFLDRQEGQLGESGSAEDDFVPGAVVVSFAQNSANVGVIVRVEQQAWNAVAARWDKTVVVRFPEGERRINPHTRRAEKLPLPPTAFLLRASEASALFRALRQPYIHQFTPSQAGHWSELRAS